MENKNMTIWDSVQETDPAYTKTFTRGGGFTGTAINPTYLIKKATGLWGAIGKGWGYNIVDEKYIEGAPFLDGNGIIICKEIIHVIRLELWFMDEGQRVTCPQQFGQTTFVGKNKYGIFTDEEAPKKTITDALTKCLVMLGFAADVHMGLYDDNKYVNDVKSRTAGAFKTKRERTALWNAIKAEVVAAQTVEELNNIINGTRKGDLNKIKLSDEGGEDSFENLVDFATRRKADIIAGVVPE